MTPTAVKQYLQRRGTAPLVDLVNRFDAEPDSVRAILAFWMGKGRVRRIAAATDGCSSHCGGCAGGACALPGEHDFGLGDLFEWLPRHGRSEQVLALDALDRLASDVQQASPPVGPRH